MENEFGGLPTRSPGGRLPLVLMDQTAFDTLGRIGAELGMTFEQTMSMAIQEFLEKRGYDSLTGKKKK